MNRQERVRIEQNFLELRETLNEHYLKLMADKEQPQQFRMQKMRTELDNSKQELIESFKKREAELQAHIEASRTTAEDVPRREKSSSKTPLQT